MKRIQDYSTRFFRLLDSIVNQESYVIKGQCIHVQISLKNIVESLDAPSHFGYADLKHRILTPLMKHINQNSQLTIEILEECRTNRTIEHIAIGLVSHNSIPSEVLATTTQFIRNKL